jgi:hypothetical protein
MALYFSDYEPPVLELLGYCHPTKTSGNMCSNITLLREKMAAVSGFRNVKNQFEISIFSFAIYHRKRTAVE